MERFLQDINIEAAFVPVDMSGAANDGDWINLALYSSVICVLLKAAGTAGQDPVFTLNQAQAADGTGSKALNFTTIYSKVGTLATTAAFTRVAQAAANTYTDAVSAEAQAIIAVEVSAEDLDINNGFTFVQMAIPDVGAAAQLGCGFYILAGARYKAGIGLDAKV